MFKNRYGEIAWGRVWLIIILALIVSVVWGCSASCNRVVEQGTKVGTVIKLSQDGVLSSCKTWEGELIRGGLSNGSGGFSTTPLYFTVNDPHLLQEVNKALDGQYEVEISYASYFGPYFCASGNLGNYFLTGIRKRSD